MAGTKEMTGLQVRQGNFVFYVAVMRASEILDLGQGIRRRRDEETLNEDESISQDDALSIVEAIEATRFGREVGRISASSYSQEDPFQRVVDEARIKELAAYLLEPEALLPNAMILATRDTTDTLVQQRGETVHIQLHWSDDFAVNIIDGQHRIESLRLLIDKGHDDFADFHVPFTLLVDYPFYLQAELFAVVNGKQKPVNRSRVYDLFGYRQISDKTVKERAYQGQLRVERFCHQIVRVLNESKASPWRDMIKMRGTGSGVVTQAAFIDELKILVMPRKDSARLARLPLLYPFLQEGDLTNAAKACIVFFMGAKKAWPSYWENEENLKKSLFGRTLGVGLSFRLFHDLVVRLGEVANLTVDNSAELWELIPEQVIATPPSTGGRGILQDIYRRVINESDLGDGQRGTEAFDAMRSKLRDQGALV